MTNEEREQDWSLWHWAIKQQEDASIASAISRESLFAFLKAPSEHTLQCRAEVEHQATTGFLPSTNLYNSYRRQYKPC